MAEDMRIEGRELARLVEALSQVLACGPLVVALARRVLGEEDGGSGARRYSREVRRAVCYIEAHYEENIDLARLARVAGCSRSSLSRAFRRETGETMRGWLRQVRLAHAAREVRAGDKVEAVMLGVGYRGKRNFYRQFRARFGTTPAGYRAAGQEASRTLTGSA